MKDMWFIDLYKAEDDEFTRSMSLNQNCHFDNISFMVFNNNSLVASKDLKTKKKDATNELPKLKDGKSFKDMLKIEEEESMIYGCD
jgi:hypothetical protein